MTRSNRRKPIGPLPLSEPEADPLPIDLAALIGRRRLPAYDSDQMSNDSVEDQYASGDRDLLPAMAQEMSSRVGKRITSDSGPDTGDLSDAVLDIDGKPMKDPRELIARLRKTVAEKDKALLEASLNNVDLREELDQAKTQSTDLQKQLVDTLKENESLSKRSADQAPATKGNWRSDADAARMEQQFRLAQKALEREHARIKEELVVTKGELHRATQQIEVQAEARRIESAQASAKMATLERQVAETASAASAAGAQLSLSSTRVKTRLAAAAGVTALLMATAGSWVWFSGTHAAPESQHASVAAEPEIHAATYVTPRTSSQTNAQLLNSQFGGGSQAAFQNALGRLNNVLSGMTGRTPEDLLKEVRRSNAKTDPSLCNFEWNGGQPALVYTGAGGVSMDASLNRCAAAVQDYLSKNGLRSLGH